MNSKQNLKIIHWNCHKLTEQRCCENRDFLHKFNPDVLSLQEIKLSLEKANYMLRFDGYSTYLKVRPFNSDKGGGVAVLVKEKIPHSKIITPDSDLEIIGLQLEFKKLKLNFYSLYNPPSKIIPIEFLRNINNNHFILVGDLNSKTKVLGCKQNDSSGLKLNELLEDTNITVFNDKTPTYSSFQVNDYEEILDLCLGSNSLVNKISNFLKTAEPCQF